MPLLQQYDSISPSGAQQLQVGPGSHLVWGARSLHTAPTDIISNDTGDTAPDPTGLTATCSPTYVLHNAPISPAPTYCPLFLRTVFPLLEPKAHMSDSLCPAVLVPQELPNNISVAASLHSLIHSSE